MTLGDLLNSVPGGWGGGAGSPIDPAWASVRITDITDDSRSVVPGSLFVARRGVSVDARRFVGDAIRAGAVAVLAEQDGELSNDVAGVPVIPVDDAQRVGAFVAERFFRNPSHALRLVGVTGTNGKTSVTGLIHQLLNNADMRCGLIGTVITDDGRSISESSQTTPGAIELSQTLASMVDCGCRAASLEVSSHALGQGRVQALRFEIGVFTNLSGDHQDYHGSMEAYAAAKARLFAMLPSHGLAVVNAADPATARMLQDCHARVVRTARHEHGVEPGEAGATVEVVGASVKGMQVAMRGAWGELAAPLPLFGEHNALNALQAVVVAHALGIPAQAIARGLTLARPARGRLDVVNGDPPGTACEEPLVLIDYAHTDDALRHALRAVRPVAEARGGRLVIVFGCGGDRDRTKRPRMGAAASELADVVVVTSDNPRTERPSDIIVAVLEGIPREQRDAVLVHADRRVAIEQAVLEAGPADVIVIAGKGHEREQILPNGTGGVMKVPFDDAQEARRALRAWRDAAIAEREGA